MSVDNARSYVSQAQALLAKAMTELDPTTPPPSGGPVISVNAGGDLQAAIDQASTQPGSTISLEAGATFVGPFVLKGNAGVTLTSRTTLPAPGVRVVPSTAAGFAKLRAPTNGEPALSHADNVAKWTMLGLEVIGDSNSNSSTVKLEPTASDLVLDRMYIHGDVVNGCKRGVGLNSGKTAVINCAILDIKRVGQDTQAIGGAWGPGPYLVENCWLEASTENILFGGTDPTTPDMVPSDIVIRRNLIRKPQIWQQRATQWQVKCLLELKSAKRVLIERNLFENSWLQAQTGYAIVITVRNQDGAAPWCTIQDVVFRDNVVRNAASFLNVLGLDDDPRVSVRMKNLQVTNNLVYGLDPKTWGSLQTGQWGSGKFVQILRGPQTVEIGNNTIVGVNGGALLQLDGTPKADGLNFHHNVAMEGDYGLLGNGTGVGTPSWDAFTENSQFINNVIRRTSTERTIPYPGSGNLLSATGEDVVDAQMKVLSKFAAAGAGCDVDAVLKAVGTSV